MLSEKQWEFLFLKWINGPLKTEEIDSLFETIDELNKENKHLKAQAEKIPHTCYYAINKTCGFGEVTPYDLCSESCPKYKKDYAEYLNSVLDPRD